MKIIDWFKRKTPQPNTDKSSVPPGRVSVPQDDFSSVYVTGKLRELTSMVTPSFRRELIPLIRKLYKVNPDVSIALQDMFKLANTGHTISFPNNTPEESLEMKLHLKQVSKKWSNYTAGIEGLVNKFIVQCFIGGAISIEAVPNNNLDGLSTIVFINPEDIIFQRLQDGVYHPYQINRNFVAKNGEYYIKLNTETYIYVGTYNDTDEPYGIPPFLSSLDSIVGQHDMRINFKHIMEIMGLIGFLEVKMEKPLREANESVSNYKIRLENMLRSLKQNIMGGMKDGVVVGYKDDHEFKLNATTQNLQNINAPWEMNQQLLANGLGVNGNIIGVSGSTTESATGVMLSKMISQLRNITMMVSHVLEFIYSLELRLAGYPNKGIKVEFATSTISDELKVQQGLEYKIRNLQALYNQGIISQEDFAWNMGYDTPDQDEPRQVENDDTGVSSINQDAQKKKREQDKDASDRRTRDKNNPNPRRHDQDSRTR